VASFCLLRLGAPHAGHAALVEVMLERESGGGGLVLVGSGDVAERPDVPLGWEERRDLLIALLLRRGVDTHRVRFAPLPELRTDGWDARWCSYLLDACRRALGGDPTRYVFGDDYAAGTFRLLTAQAPALELVRVARRYDKSARELRLAIATHDEALLAKYAEELLVYSAQTCARIARVCAASVDRPQSCGSPPSP
jgi:nicotinamide mononucleotide adenylyltransferase